MSKHIIQILIYLSQRTAITSHDQIRAPHVYISKSAQIELAELWAPQGFHFIGVLST